MRASPESSGRYYSSPPGYMPNQQPYYGPGYQSDKNTSYNPANRSPYNTQGRP
jgi:hypothetical protein